MLWSGLDRAYYFAVLKDTDDIYGERVKFDRAYTDQASGKSPHRYDCDRAASPAEQPGLLSSADTVIIRTSATVNVSRMYHAEHVRIATPNPNTGKFDCGQGSDYDCISCADHLYIPDLIPLPVHEVNGRGSIYYRICMILN